MSLLSIFKRGPSQAQQHVDHWLEDRAAAMQAYFKRRSEVMDFDELLDEFGPMLRREVTVREWEKQAEIERIQKLKAALPNSSRFTVLRMKRGLPFKSRRQL